MAAVLKPLAQIPFPAASVYAADPDVVERSERRRLLRDPRVWSLELIRLLFYVLARVIAVPWLLVWPAVVFWVLWVSAEFDVAKVGMLMQSSLGPQIGWTYVIGATFHSLSAIGCRPYESEVDRRLEAYMTHWHARRGWQQRQLRQSS